MTSAAMLRPDIEIIVKHVAEHGNVRVADIMEHNRTAKASAARHVAQFLAHHLLLMGPVEIGRQFGRDHSTVIHAIKTVQGRVRANKRFGRMVADDLKLLRVKLDTQRASTPEAAYLCMLPEGVRPC